MRTCALELRNEKGLSVLHLLLLLLLQLLLLLLLLTAKPEALDS